MDYKEPLFWLFCNVLTVALLAFFSMMEMACVSFNKVRLHYYVSKRYRPATRIHFLLRYPFRLFGTTLIAVNAFMALGSECSRQFYESLGLHPGLAPLTQVIFVIIFGELVPIFAARQFSEHVGLLGSFFLYYVAKLMTPFLWFLGKVSHFFHKIMGLEGREREFFLDKEELQRVLEEHEGHQGGGEEWNIIISNFLGMKFQQATEVMTVVKEIPQISNLSTVAQARSLLKRSPKAFLLVYRQNIKNIYGYVFYRDLLGESEKDRLDKFVSFPWFITQNTPLMEIIYLYRQNLCRIFFILDHEGGVIGSLDIWELLHDIFSPKQTLLPLNKQHGTFTFKRTYPGSKKLKELQEQFSIDIEEKEDITLAELMEKHLGHHPVKGESVIIASYEFIVAETSLLEVKFVTVKKRK